MPTDVFHQYWLLAHSAAIGGTIDDLLEMFPDLHLSGQSNDVTQFLIDGQGVTFLGFRNLVFGLIVETESELPWQNLTASVAKELAVPKDAFWVEDAAAKATKSTYIGQQYGSGLWFFDDYSIILRFENGLATIRIALQSVTKQVNELTQNRKGPLGMEEIAKRGVLPVALFRAQATAGTRFYDLSGLLLMDERAYWNIIDYELNSLLNEGRSQKDILIEDTTHLSNDPTLVRQFFRQVRQIKSAHKVSWLWVLRNFFHPIAAPSGCLRKS
jgi:hypothetical protein